MGDDGCVYVAAQPLAETDRIDDSTAPQVAQGNSGADDELIQLETLRASEGHVPAMLSLGDMHYYGTRGW